MSLYLCYDVKGIQSFVFAVPRLRYIVGGSSLLDTFDRKVVPSFQPGLHIYSAGGKGAFEVSSEDDAHRLRRRLVEQAHQRGFDISFGQSEDFATAANEAGEVHLYIPDNLDGEPCRASGLYPVPPGGGRGYADDGGGVHDIVWKRVRDGSERTADALNERLLGSQSDRADRLTLPAALEGKRVRFFTSVSRDAEDDDVEGMAGAAALGNRNRWAIVAMDGNDMGAQYRQFFATKPSAEKTTSWLKRMGGALDECTRGACVAGIEAVLGQWSKGPDCRPDTTLPGEDMVLPVRPLVVGGDDVIALVHPAYAMVFVRTVCERFATMAASAHRRHKDLWIATNGELTISAGVLYAPVGLPLASAIPYAESLLASAKGLGRKLAATAAPSPACVDWEAVTEGLLETPAARRQRELRFRDTDLDQVVELTQRPYTIEMLTKLDSLVDKLASLPRSAVHGVLPGLRAGFEDRQVYVARMSKNQQWLAACLREQRQQDKATPDSRWRQDGDTRSTDIVFACLLLQEERRMERETANA